MVRSKEELLASIKGILGDNTSDEALALIEDTTDTLADLSGRIENAGDWQKKYEDNDAEWRKKYRDRFYEGVETEETDDGKKDDTVVEKLTYDNLFKEEE